MRSRSSVDEAVSFGHSFSSEFFRLLLFETPRKITRRTDGWQVSGLLLSLEDEDGERVLAVGELAPGVLASGELASGVLV